MNRIKYKKIGEKEIIDVLLRTSEDWDGCANISPSNIASLLKTSRYQVNKHIKSLKEKGLIKYKMTDISDEYEYHPPYFGYCLSELGKKNIR